MRRRLGAALSLALALAVAAAAPASATNIYIVEGTAESPLATCPPIAGAPAYFRCGSLRAAVNAANAAANSAEDLDLIWLQAAGTYTVTSALELTGDVSIFGRGPRTTTVRGSGAARVFVVTPGVSANLYRLTVSGGQTSGAGGNILSYGQLFLLNVRVTAGVGGSGGGIANVGGELLVSNSLVDHNSARTTGVGGGILSEASEAPASLDVLNSTIAFNDAPGEDGGGRGGGVASIGASNQTTLTAVTIAHNEISGTAGAGLYLEPANATASAYGSLFGANLNGSGALASCSGPVVDTGPASNVEDGSSCFDVASGDLGLGAALANVGGDTDVVTIPASGPAKDAVAVPCVVISDQRAAQRTTGACDAGAFEQGAVAPPVSDAAFTAPVPPVTQPPPPPPPPPPAPTPTPTPEPTPVVNKTVVVKTVKGKIRIRVPGSKKFVELDATQGIPTGSTIDAKAGRVQLSSVPKAGGAVQTAVFYQGIFKVTQKRGLTDLRLTEKLAPCGKRGGAKAAAKKAKKPKKRRLWGDGKGRFRTTGRYSAATVRGTKWLVQDSCAGTLTRVKVGSVKVLDNVRKRTRVVRAGKSYLARPKK